MPLPAAGEDSGKRKRVVVDLSSSSSSDPEDDDEDEASIASDSEDEMDDDDDESLSEGDDSDFVVDDENDDDSDGDCDSDDSGGDENGESGAGGVTDEERCRKVVELLKKQRNLDILKLEDCKAYLRKHSLMLSGSKGTCIKRIMEHSRIKDANGEKLYPRSSFTINCTGDVCKGDVVLFRQRVYDKFDKVKRSSKIIGKRIVAGRIVKESYGAAKQQHTFTVEVLWTKGEKVLTPLCSLLVKGRNLYRLKTFRQPWSNEAERIKILEEKHRRGAAARQIRQTRKARKARYATTAASSSHENLSGARLAPKAQKREQLKPAHKRRKQNSSSDKARHRSSVRTDYGAKQPVITRNSHTQGRKQIYTNNAGRSTDHGAEQPVITRNSHTRGRNQIYINNAGQSQSHPPGMMKHIPMTRNPSEQFRDLQANYSERGTHYQHPFPPRMPFHDNYNGLNTQHYPTIRPQPRGSFASHHDLWSSGQVVRQPSFFHGSAASSDTQFYWWRP